MLEARPRRDGAPKHGDALLAGLVRCRRCVCKLTVRYTGVKQDIPRYSCWRGLLDNGEPRCIAFGGLRVDDAIKDALLRVVEPGAITAAAEAEAQVASRRDQLRDALARDLEAARYGADRAFRHYDAADPIGGVHTELRLPKRRRGQRNSTAPEIIAAVGQLVLLASDDLIAGILHRNGLLAGHGNRWTQERVTALGSHQKIPVFRPAPDGTEPWLNLTNAARLLGVMTKTLRLAAEGGSIEGVHPLSDRPWIFARAELGKPAAQQLTQRARQNPKYPTRSQPDQQNLFTSEA